VQAKHPFQSHQWLRVDVPISGVGVGRGMVGSGDGIVGAGVGMVGSGDGIVGLGVGVL